MPRAVALALTTLCGGAPFAQTNPPAAPADPADSTALSLGEVVVSGSGGPLVTRRVLTSVDILPRDRIENQSVLNNWQLLDQVPGVMITQFGQGTTSGKFSMRGFNGEGNINAVKLLIDGVPSNSNDGNMPYIDVVPKLDIDAIEVVRGTNDPRYGLHNIAGNANIVTRSGGNYKLGRLTLGSFGTREAQAAIGIDNNGFSQNYAVSRQLVEGYRDHSASDSATFSGKWFLSPNNGSTRVGMILRHYGAHAQEAGYLTGDQATANPRQSPPYNESDNDRRRATQLAIQGETDLGRSLFAAGQVYMNDLDDRRFVRFGATASQQERYVAERHVGASVNLTWRAGKSAIGDLSVTGGVDTELQDNRSERYSTNNQVRTAQTRNQQFDFNTVGAFVQAVIKPTDKLTIVPAYRIDRITGSYRNLLNNQSYGANDYGLIPQPKLSAIYAIDPKVSAYANWGRTFQVGVGTSTYKVGQTSDLSPSINDGWEAGFKFKPQPWLDGRVAVWRQTATNEFARLLNDPANASQNVGGTRRQGIDFQLNARPTSRLGLWLAVASQSSKVQKVDPNDAAAVATLGKEIDHVPHLLFNLGFDYQATDAWRVSAWASGQSSYYLETTNATGQFGAYKAFNASVGYRVNAWASVDVQFRNLTNRYTEYVWWDGAQALHGPANPRSVFASVNIRF